MTTFNDAVNEARLRHGSIDTTKALEWAIRVYDELALRCEISRKSFDVSLTAGTAEYSIPATVLRFHHADYVQAANQASPLTETPLELIEEIDPSFRATLGEGVPRRIAITLNEGGTKIRLYPVPETTTDAGYPKVVLYATTRPAIIGSTALPDLLINKDLFVDGILAKHAKLFRDQDYPMLAERYQMAMDEAVTSLKGISAGEQTTIRPDFMTSIRKVL
jgi:hypothetical protein